MDRLERVQKVARPLEEVFSFFADPANLEQLTPPWLGFTILQASTPTTQQGTTINYRLRIRGIPLRWQSIISNWNPPHSFVDEQVRGPYRSWHHTHNFVQLDNGVRVEDLVRYSVPGGRLVNWLFIRRDLERIFDYRVEQMERIFAGDNR